MTLAAREPASICMATYNGARYLGEQLATILEQLRPEDEVVIVDDGSTDGTLELLSRLGDPRIKVFRNPENRGHVASFARAASLASRDVIVFADQDDRWLPGRLDRLVQVLGTSGALVLASNSRYMSATGGPTDFRGIPLRAADSRRHLKNLIDIFRGQAGYYGCAMAYRRSLSKVVLPMPRLVESHDLWIALAGNLLRANVHIDDETLVRRVHGGNASIVRRPLHQRLWARVLFALSVLVLGYRAIRHRPARAAR